MPRPRDKLPYSLGNPQSAKRLKTTEALDGDIEDTEIVREINANDCYSSQKSTNSIFIFSTGLDDDDDDDALCDLKNSSHDDSDIEQEDEELLETYANIEVIEVVVEDLTGEIIEKEDYEIADNVLGDIIDIIIKKNDEKFLVSSRWPKSVKEIPKAGVDPSLLAVLRMLPEFRSKSL